MAGPVDLADAVLQRLRATSCAAAFGDTWDAVAQAGVQKFYAEYAYEYDLPVAVVTEPGEAYTYMSHSPGFPAIWNLADGTLAISIYAADRRQARVLGLDVVAALNDQVQALQWPGQVLNTFRCAGAAFVPYTGTGPNVPSVFVRTLSFIYQIQESF